MKITFELETNDEKGIEALLSLTKVVANPVKTETPKKSDTPKSNSGPDLTKPKEASKKIEEPKKEASFEDLDDEAKLEVLKTEVTKLVKKSKGEDVKKIFARFNVNKTSELSPDQYGDFYDLLTRLGKGETIEAILGEDFN